MLYFWDYLQIVGNTYHLSWIFIYTYSESLFYFNFCSRLHWLIYNKLKHCRKPSGKISNLESKSIYNYCLIYMPQCHHVYFQGRKNVYIESSDSPILWYLFMEKVLKQFKRSWRVSNFIKRMSNLFL